MHSGINREVAKDPNCSCLDAMKELKREVLRKCPDACDTDENARRVKQTATKKHQNCKHQNEQQKGNCHPDAKLTTLKNGKKPWCHHTFRFDTKDFKSFTHQQKQTLFGERKNANSSSNKRGNRNQGSDQESNHPGNWKKEMQEEGSRFVKSLMSQLKESVANSVSEITQQNDNTPPGLPSSIVGGRNSQTRNKGGRTE